VRAGASHARASSRSVLHPGLGAFGLLVLLTLALALACAGAPEADERAADADTSADAGRDTLPGTPVLSIDGEGLRLVDPTTGRTTALPFGTPEARVLDALARSGRALRTDAGSTSPCALAGVRARTWPDGFAAVFGDGAFVGWELDERSDGTITTLSGVGIGSTREDLEWSYVAHVRREVDGTTFTAGALRGTFEGDGSAARIRSLWAGTTCEPRDAPGALEPVAPETHGVVFEGIPPFEDLIADRDGDWLVVLGSFPIASGVELDRPGRTARTATLMRPSDPQAAALQQKLWNEGVVPFVARSDVLPNFAPGAVVLVVGPYPRANAEDRLAALRRVAPDAYLKSGW
jgi:hypothetical protein